MANRSTPARSAWGEVLTRKDAPSIGSHSRTSPFAERALCQLERAGRRGEMGAALPCGRHPVHVRWGWMHAFWLCVGRAPGRLVDAPADDRSWSGAGGHRVSFAPTRGQSKRRVTPVLRAPSARRGSNPRPRCPVSVRRCPVSRPRCPAARSRCPVSPRRCPVCLPRCPVSLSRSPSSSPRRSAPDRFWAAPRGPSAIPSREGRFFWTGTLLRVADMLEACNADAVSDDYFSGAPPPGASSRSPPGS